MDLHPIRSEEEYRAALKSVSPYFDNEPELGTADARRFDALLVLIEAWEAEHYPIPAPDPIEARKFRMEQEGRPAEDL